MERQEMKERENLKVLYDANYLALSYGDIKKQKVRRKRRKRGKNKNINRKNSKI